ncbi:hypothetical protein, partial [Amnibacterium sp.]|uniref:hypothetical protein n=1 Tax=Amnibacterium sp. TaxID=1872496 RepID=UPI002618A786
MSKWNSDTCDIADAMAWIRDPEQPGPTGNPSPFAGLAAAREAMYRRGASEEVRSRFSSLAAAYDRFCREVAAATEAAAAGVAADPVRPARHYGARSRIAVGAAVSSVAVVLAAWAWAEVHPSRPSVVTPPAVPGAVLASYSDRPLSGMGDEAVLYWPAGYRALSSGGRIEVGLRCWGNGNVVVTLGGNGSIPFVCRDVDATLVRRS